MMPGNGTREAKNDPPPASIRCYAELNDYLPPELRQTTFPWPAGRHPRLDQVITELHIPAEMIDMMLVNGVSVSFDHRLAPGQRVSLYPMFEALDVAPLCRLPGRPLRNVRFVADVHLARLARMLRMLGFDTLWWSHARDEDLVGSAENEGRVLLTRDRALCAREEVTRALWVRSSMPVEQVRAVLERLDLYARLRPFTRCMVCNGEVMPVAKTTVTSRVPPGALREHDEFFACAVCGKVYWKGSHYLNMRALVDALISVRSGGDGHLDGLGAAVADAAPPPPARRGGARGPVTSSKRGA